jgi:hypothetical protein
MKGVQAALEKIARGSGSCDVMRRAFGRLKDVTPVSIVKGSEAFASVARIRLPRTSPV